MKTFEKQRFSGVFRGYNMETTGRNRSRRADLFYDITSEELRKKYTLENLPFYPLLPKIPVPYNPENNRKPKVLWYFQKV